MTALAEQLRFLQNASGAVPGPMDCWLALRGTQDAGGADGSATSENARSVADFLAGHPR